jgi:hypothetical protein
VRQGDRVTPSTLITTIDAAEGLEAYINVPLERRDRLRPGLTVELLDMDGKVIASDPITFIAPRADDATQSILVKATLQRRPAASGCSSTCARASSGRRAGDCSPRCRREPHQRSIFVYVAEEAAGGLVARQKPVTVGD